MPENVFADEWRECLEAHYMHVIRTRDKVTEPSLTVVMRQAGFNDSELAELRVRATMHVDDAGADFVPDMNVLDAVAEARVFAAAVPDAPPVETVVEAAVSEPEATHLTEELIDEIEEAAAEAELLAGDPAPDVPEDDPDAPQQLTLF